MKNFLKMIPIVEKELALYSSEKNCHICYEKFPEDAGDNNIWKL